MKGGGRAAEDRRRAVNQARRCLPPSILYASSTYDRHMRKHNAVQRPQTCRGCSPCALEAFRYL